MHVNVCVTVKTVGVGGGFFIWWRKVGRIWRIQLLFCRCVCVRIEIDQLLCVICWVINHSLSVSCKKINHSHSALVIWSTLQLTSKQWFISLQLTARDDLFLKQSPHMKSQTHKQRRTAIEKPSWIGQYWFYSFDAKFQITFVVCFF